MSLLALTPEDVALIGRALRLMASGEVLQEWEFGARIGVEFAEFRTMLERWPAWNDVADNSPECLAINNTLNDLLCGIGMSDRQCREMLDASREALLQVYQRWAAARGWSATGVK
jgi:hypothetical protein